MAQDIFLTWSRGNALTEAVGILQITGLAPGESRVVHVPHAAVPFAFCEPPRFSTTEGDTAPTVEVLARAVVGGTARMTDGEGFVVRVTVPQDASGEDWTLHWTRRGVAQQ